MKDSNSFLRGAADRIDCGIDNIGALLGAVDDKMSALYRDRSLFGNSWLLIKPSLESMQTLLSLAESILFDVGKDASIVSDALYKTRREVEHGGTD